MPIASQAICAAVVGDTIIDLSAMLTELDTVTWETITKKVGTIYHTREFYTTSDTRDGYSADWSDPGENQSPTAAPIALALTEYDEHAQAPTPIQFLKQSICLLSPATRIQCED